MTTIVTFEIPVDKVHTVQNYTASAKQAYNTQSAYYPGTRILEITVDLIYRNGVVNLALAYGYLLLHE